MTLAARLVWWWRLRRMPPGERLELDRRLTIARLRARMASFGHPLDHLSDQQIEEGCAALARGLRSAGVTMAEANERMRRIFAAVRTTMVDQGNL